MKDAKATVDAQLVDLRAHLAHMSATVDETAGALRRGTEKVDGDVTDLRDAMGSVRSSVGSVASAVASPKAALAFGVMQGIQALRKRRAVHRPDEDATSQS
jgi:hypothetical protein